MKNLMLMIAAATIISLNACGQNAKDVPAKVKAGFDQKFATAQKVKWGKENANEWEADFTFNGRTYSANYKSDGTWVETEYSVAMKEVPAEVLKTLAKEAPGYKRLGSDISETPNGIVYEFDIKTGNIKKEVAINADGTLVKKETKTKKGDRKD